VHFVLVVHGYLCPARDQLHHLVQDKAGLGDNVLPNVL
jgi:hypothetical protein